MRPRFHYLPMIFILTGLLITSLLSAQTSNSFEVESLKNIIFKLDGGFWKSYNSCDMEALTSYITNDVEFYHDKGGLITTLPKLLEQIKSGLCGNENGRLRREAIEGSIVLYPLNGYGAILSGEHIFYMQEEGKKDRPVEQAKFTHVWRYDNNTWKMSRILSYDHRPISINSFKREINIPIEVLKRYVGKYHAPEIGTITVVLIDDQLVVKTDEMDFKIHPETESIFFHKESPITFKFMMDSTKKVTKFMVHENDVIVEQAIRLD